MRIIKEKIKTSRGEGYIMKCIECGNTFRIKRYEYKKSHKGRFCSRKCYWIFLKENSKGDKNPNWKGGKVQIRCRICGKRKMVKQKDIRNGGGKYCSRECKDIDNSRIMKEYYKNNPEHKYKTRLVGSKNGRWLGGKSFEPYGIEFNRRLRKEIRKRDDFTCQKCGKTEKELNCRLAVHHIDYNKKNNNPNNLISLCSSCHSITNTKRGYWEKYLSNLIQNTNKDIF